MLRLNIGSGMLRLISCMLSIGQGPTPFKTREGGLLRHGESQVLDTAN